ncbi:hypothetical protein [Volucribacter amazonae]|uniref:Uncharacterized protein n=1 Tax=Volucribacter amazonae TaxID=256731 RepID=A0A9X4PIF3_9PAST|nr:hypothetical protein [Volucribacter amazonae]MDG6895855.1 hypothetical protein [Volucribacter amazonae]
MQRKLLWTLIPFSLSHITYATQNTYIEKLDTIQVIANQAASGEYRINQQQIEQTPIGNNTITEAI